MLDINTRLVTIAHMYEKTDITRAEGVKLLKQTVHELQFELLDDLGDVEVIHEAT